MSSKGLSPRTEKTIPFASARGQDALSAAALQEPRAAIHGSVREGLPVGRACQDPRRRLPATHCAPSPLSPDAGALVSGRAPGSPVTGPGRSLWPLGR